jgi:hypothetical protein
VIRPALQDHPRANRNAERKILQPSLVGIHIEFVVFTRRKLLTGVVRKVQAYSNTAWPMQCGNNHEGMCGNDQRW